MSATERLVAVLGAGVMGAGIAQGLAQHGVDVVCRDPDASVLDTAKTGLRGGRFGLARAVERGHMTAQEAAATEARLRWTTDVGDVADATLIIECVPEDPALKQRVLAEVADMGTSPTGCTQPCSPRPRVSSRRDCAPSTTSTGSWSMPTPGPPAPSA